MKLYCTYSLISNELALRLVERIKYDVHGSNSQMFSICLGQNSFGSRFCILFIPMDAFNNLLRSFLFQDKMQIFSWVKLHPDFFVFLKFECPRMTLDNLIWSLWQFQVRPLVTDGFLLGAL